MALIVEDGTGLENAESLASVAAANAYHTGRLNAAWGPVSAATKEAMLRRGFDFLVGEYAADWPVDEPFGVIDGAVPARVMQANALLALYALAGPLAPERKPQKIKSELGPIKSEYAVDTRSVREFPDVQRLMSPYLETVGNNPYMVPLERS